MFLFVLFDCFLVWFVPVFLAVVFVCLFGGGGGCWVFFSLYSTQ